MHTASAVEVHKSKEQFSIFVPLDFARSKDFFSKLKLKQ